MEVLVDLSFLFGPPAIALTGFIVSLFRLIAAWIGSKKDSKTYTEQVMHSRKLTFGVWTGICLFIIVLFVGFVLIFRDPAHNM